MCAEATKLGVFAHRFWVQCKRMMAETERETELTTVVLDGDVIGQQLVLASHSNEQRTSSPGWRSGGRMESLVRDRRWLRFGDAQHCQIQTLSLWTALLSHVFFSCLYWITSSLDSFKLSILTCIYINLQEIQRLFWTAQSSALESERGPSQFHWLLVSCDVLLLAVKPEKV